jgi:uncharacterized SAM-binding protein YcdF (DUF218 family)
VSLFVVALCALVLLVSWKSILTGLGSFLVEDDVVQKADAAVVLGGDSNGVRVLRAAQLAQAGYVPFVIVDGPKTLVGYESDMNIAYAVQHGYQASLFHALPMPPPLNSTHEEAEFVGRYLKQQGIHKILLVTSNYHTHRAAYLFRKKNPWLEVVAVPAPDPDYHPDSWWTFRPGRRTFLTEWTKTFAAYADL